MSIKIKNNSKQISKKIVDAFAEISLESFAKSNTGIRDKLGREVNIYIYQLHENQLLYYNITCALVSTHVQDTSM